MALRASEQLSDSLMALNFSPGTNCSIRQARHGWNNPANLVAWMRERHRSESWPDTGDPGNGDVSVVPVARAAMPREVSQGRASGLRALPRVNMQATSALKATGRALAREADIQDHNAA